MILVANILCIIVMICVWLFVLAFLCRMPFSLSYCFRRWIFQGDTKYLKWLWENKYYLKYYFFLIVLLPMIALMLGSFMHNKIFDRPELLIWLSPFLWVAIAMIIDDRINWSKIFVNK